MTGPKKINLLPDEVASKIAAGEVVERPASVVRELLDNAIDSGARNIRVEIRGGGRDLIRIIDDGCGIFPDDMPKAFLRHATSKINTADDLWSVRTLGFRGEALYSIAAISRMQLLSRTSASQSGYELAVEGGRLVADGPRGAPPGTIVAVRELFFNLPARLEVSQERAGGRCPHNCAGAGLCPRPSRHQIHPYKRGPPDFPISWRRRFTFSRYERLRS